MKNSIEKTILPILFITLLTAHIALVWLLPYFPTQDGPSHIYNLSILKDLRSGGELWGEMYTQELSFKPNLGFHIIAYPLLYFFEPLIVEKLFVSIYLLLLITSVPALLKMIDRPIFPWSFLVFPAALSYGLAMGFYSYVIALPLVLLAGGICWRMRNRGLPKQCCVITICATIIYSFHLIWSVYFVILIAIQQLVSRSGNIGRKMRDTTFLLMPPGLLLLGYIISSAKEPQFAPTPFTERIYTVIADIIFFGTVYFSTLQIINGIMICVVIYLLILFDDKRDLSDTDKVFGGFFAALVIINLCAPSSFGGGSYFNERIPQMILLAFIPAIAGRKLRRDYSRLGRFLLPALSVVCFTVNFQSYREKSALVEDYMSLINTPVTKKTAITSYRNYGIERSRIDVLLHTISYYALKHTLLNSGNYEANLNYFPVKFSPDVRNKLPSTDSVNYFPERVDLEKYHSIIYILTCGVNCSEQLGKYYTPVSFNGNLTLWKRNL